VVSSAKALLFRIAARVRFPVALALLALLLPAFAVRLCALTYADRLGAGIAAGLIAVVPSLPAPASEGVAGEFVDAEPPVDARPSVQGVVFAGKQPRHASHPPPSPKHGIRITSAQVLALAARRAMPQAVFVQASAAHPAGLLLAGVSGLGVGLQDGDVLTEAAGQKATSVAAVVGIVLAARSRQASEISGRFYRGGVPFLLTVEQPYPRQPLPG